MKTPDEVLDAYLRLPRPTPLFRVRRLEAYLKTSAKIYFKCEYANPASSRKPNTAIRAYYRKAQGAQLVVTETGAGQGSSFQQ